jgi:hypothetical protein
MPAKAMSEAYLKGLGLMSAMARTAANKKGFENGIAKGLEAKAEAKSESWEVQFAEFDDYDGMPERETTLYNWQRNQLTGLDGKIKKEIETNEGGTVCVC